MRPIHQRVFAPSILDVWPFESSNALGKHFIFMDDNDDEPSSLIHHLIGGCLKEASRQPQKHRIQVNLRGLSPKCVKAEISTDDKSKLVVSGKETEKYDETNDDGDFFAKELRRTFKLPSNLETDKMTTFVARNGQLVIEIPFKKEEEKKKKRVHSEIDEAETTTTTTTTTTNGEKRVRVSIELPENVDESKIKVTCKDRDVIVEAVIDEPATSSPQGVSSQLYFYRRNTLPKYADMDAVKCMLENKTLTIEAPHLPGQSDIYVKTIPIDVKQQQQQQQTIEKTATSENK